MVKCLEQSVVPTKNRVKHVEYITAVYDFKKWLQSGLQISLSGHGSSSTWKEAHMESCHLYRFIKRRNLPKFAEEACGTEFTEPTHKDDIIILVKYRMASDGYAQPPQCFAPNQRFENLAKTVSSLQMAPRSVLSARQAKEFLKTAKAVTQPPWEMTRASEYLTNLVERNEMVNTPAWELPQIAWALSPWKLQPEDGAFLAGDLPADVMTPVWVQTGPASTLAKRPTAAKSKAKGSGRQRAAARPKTCARSPGGHEAGNVPQPAERPIAPPLAGAPNGLGEPGAPERAGVERQPRKHKITRLDQLPPLPEGVKLGCGSCRQADVGCRGCRARVNLFETSPGTWEFTDAPPVPACAKPARKCARKVFARPAGSG